MVYMCSLWLASTHLFAVVQNWVNIINSGILWYENLDSMAILFFRHCMPSVLKKHNRMLKQ